MADIIQRVDYFYTTVEDKPGEWRRLLELFKEKGISFLALTAFPTGDGNSQLDFFPVDSAEFREAASAAGVGLTGPQKAFLVQGDDRVGALVELHQKLSEVGINVHAVNGVSGGAGRFGYIFWVNPSDFSNAARALGV